jgi:hypothetical protein
MKKYLFLLLAMLPILFVACSSDDDETASLKGTTWVCSDKDEGVRTLVFNKTEFLYTLNSDQETVSIKGTYTYNPPLITLTGKDPKTNKEETMTGSINKDKLSIGEIVYTKQK